MPRCKSKKRCTELQKSSIHVEETYFVPKLEDSGFWRYNFSLNLYIQCRLNQNPKNYFGTKFIGFFVVFTFFLLVFCFVFFYALSFLIFNFNFLEPSFNNLKMCNGKKSFKLIYGEFKFMKYTQNCKSIRKKRTEKKCAIMLTVIFSKW